MTAGNDHRRPCGCCGSGEPRADAAAIKNCGFRYRQRSATANLAPADLKKEGNYLDLAIELSTLAVYGQLPSDALSDRLVSGELGLDGSVLPIRGVLAIAERTY